MISRKLISVVLSVAFVLIITTPSFSETTYKMRVVTILSKTDPVGLALQQFADTVNKNSNGRIKATAFFGSELGTQREQCEMVQSGSLEMVTSLTSGTGRYVPQLAVFAFPYVFKDDEHVVRSLDAMEDEVSRLLAPHNFVAIAGQNMGFRHCLIKAKPVYKVEDFDSSCPR